MSWESGRQIVREAPGEGFAYVLDAAESSPKVGNGQGWIRTSEGVKPADLQSAPFGHSGTYPFASVDIGSCSTCCKSALRRGSLHRALGEDGPPMPSSLLLTPAFRPVVRHPAMRRKPFQRLSCGLQTKPLKRNHRRERALIYLSNGRL